MKTVELTEYLIKELASDPDAVSVKGLDTEEYLIIEVLVGNEDIGRIIGKNGKLITSIRTLVNAASYHNGEKKVKINIDSV